MNLSHIEHLKKMNPTGIDWEDMTEEQKNALREQWQKVVSEPKNLNCTCPRTSCRNNRNCNFCVLTHCYYGSLPDCLRFVDDKISAGVPPEKRHNVHTGHNPGQIHAANRNDYANGLMERGKEFTEEQKAKMRVAARERVENWHRLVRDPDKNKCSCPRTDCWYHGNCVKCCALHRHYDGFPDCAREIHDKIDAAVQAYKAENSDI